MIPRICIFLSLVKLLYAKVVLLAFKPLLHNPFLWKERKINSIIAMIVLLLIASLVVSYLPLYHSALSHPEWNTPCGVNLLLPYIRLSPVLPYFSRDLNILVMHFLFLYLHAKSFTILSVPCARYLPPWPSSPCSHQIYR